MTSSSQEDVLKIEGVVRNYAYVIIAVVVIGFFIMYAYHSSTAASCSKCSKQSAAAPGHRAPAPAHGPVHAHMHAAAIHLQGHHAQKNGAKHGQNACASRAMEEEEEAYKHHEIHPTPEEMDAMNNNKHHSSHKHQEAYYDLSTPPDVPKMPSVQLGEEEEEEEDAEFYDEKKIRLPGEEPPSFAEHYASPSMGGCAL